MKKRIFALLLAVVLAAGLVPASAAAQTAPAAPVSVEEAAKTLAALNIMSGDLNGDLRLEQKISRAELTKMAVACSAWADSVGSAAGVKPYPDVPREKWYAPYIELARDKGLVAGRTDGRFYPDEYITLAETATILARLLGYQDSDLPGRWPSGQMALFRTLGLDKGVTAAERGDITRGDALYIFYNLLTAKTKSGQTYAVTLGYTVANGKVDYMAQAKKELEGPFLSDGKAPAYAARTTYLNDRVVKGLILEKNDVYYYNTTLGLLWAYRDTVFGEISALTPSAAEPTAVTVKGKSYTLATDEVKDTLSGLGDDPAGTLVTLLLGMDGKAVAAHVVNGPFVAEAGDTLTFTPKSVTINGRSAETLTLEQNDVYYISPEQGKVWAYRDTVFGEIGALTPSAAEPTAVTVKGKSYTLATDEVKDTLSGLGDDPAGTLVTLLLGMDGKAVAAHVVSGPFVAEAGETLTFTPETIWLNDREAAGLTLEEDDVYYTSEGTGVLWVYRDTVFGQVGALTPSAADPTAVTVGGKSYALATDQVKAKLSALGDRSAGSLVTLLLGMDGKAVAAHTVNGPFVAADGEPALPFAPAQTYRDGKLSAAAVPGLYDVYYYDADAETVWIYTKRVSGKITALTPSVLAPTAVSVDGVSYALQSNALTRRFSALNGDWVGQYITLLFGMDGSVVEALTGKTVAADYYGLVQSVQKGLADGTVQTNVTVFCTDGRSRTFTAPADGEYKAGELLHAALTAEGVTVEKVKETALSGRVNKAATQVGELTFAEDLEVLDTADGRNVVVEVSALAGLTLSKDNVRFYTRNAAGEVDRLILKDVTGALWDYAYLTGAAEQKGTGVTFTTRYTYLLGGRSQTTSVSNHSWPVKEETGVALRFGGDGALKAVKTMGSAKLTALTSATAYASNRSFPLAEEVQVWLLDGEVWYSVELKDVNATDYDLTGWYDGLRNQVQVIMAKPKK